jgi:hypothetical protein
MKYVSRYPELAWQYILFEHNEDDVPKAIELAKELGMDIYFKLDWSGNFKPKNEKKLKELTGLGAFNRTDYMDITGKSYLVNQICRQMIFQPVINYDGRLLGCCRVMNEDWGVNVFTDGLLEALNSPRYKEAILALLEKDGMSASDTPCGRCKHMKNKGITLEL